MALRKKAISFGLVYIPIELKPIIKNNDTAFNQLHKKCGSRIKYKKICSHCETEVQTKDIIKAYEYDTDKYVTFSEEDFNKIELNNTAPIEIISFINLSEVDPIYFEKSYYLAAKSNKAFDLFKAALKKEKKIALAKTVIGTKFYYGVLRFERNNIIFNTLYFEEEINLEDEPRNDVFTKEEMDLATKLIKAMEGNFEPQKYKDEYQTKIKDAIDKKISGKKIVRAKEKPQKNVKDLMDALKMSLKETKK